MSDNQFPPGWWIGFALLIGAVCWTLLGLAVFLFCGGL